MTRPTVVIVPELATDESPGEGLFARYVLNQAYAVAVEAAGGFPIILPYTDAAPEMDALLDGVDGAVLSGGALDLDPGHYGETSRGQIAGPATARAAFELRLAAKLLERRTPVLGICGGMQTLNVVCGGSLWQHLPEDVPAASSHEMNTDRTAPHHEVEISPGSLLLRVLGAPTLAVNSTHHQAVRSVGEGLTVSARAPDGVVEAIEREAGPNGGSDGGWLLAVQWHPELMAVRGHDHHRHQRIYAALVEAARLRRRNWAG